MCGGPAGIRTRDFRPRWPGHAAYGLRARRSTWLSYGPTAEALRLPRLKSVHAVR